VSRIAGKKKPPVAGGSDSLFVFLVREIRWIGRAAGASIAGSVAVRYGFLDASTQFGNGRQNTLGIFEVQ